MSRKTNRDHAKRQQRPMIEDEAISAQISALLTPALAKQKKYCRQLGLRDRILTLPLMVAAILTMLWRVQSKVVDRRLGSAHCEAIAKTTKLNRLV